MQSDYTFSRAFLLAPLQITGKIEPMKYIRVLPAELSTPNRENGAGVGESKDSSTPPPLSPIPADSCRSQALPNIPESSPQSGAQVPAHHVPRPPGFYDKKPDVTLICPNCHQSFTRTWQRARRLRAGFCSPECGCAARVGKPPEGFVTPESDHRQRVAANGLVNKRLKLGWFVKPTACMKCGQVKKLDSHHPNYSKPAEVLWLCRRHHMQAHHDPTSVAHIPPFICDEKIPRHLRLKPVVRTFHGNQHVAAAAAARRMGVRHG